MSELFKTTPKSLPEKTLIIIKEISDKYQGSIWEMVYRQDKCQSTPIKRRQSVKSEQTNEDKTKKDIRKANDNWNDWKFQLHWNKLEWVDMKT